VSKRATKSPSTNRSRGSSDTGPASNARAALELGPDLDLSALIVEIDLEKLVLDLEVSDDVERPLAAHDTPLATQLVQRSPHGVQSPAPVTQPPGNDIDIAATERRLAARLLKSEVGDDVQVSLPRAARTVLVNVSDTGVLIETNCQLFPGRTTDVFVKLCGERQALRATVVRSCLHSLTPEAAVYRSALHFERIIGVSNLLR
jgi:hypothetical protein